MKNQTKAIWVVVMVGLLLYTSRTSRGQSMEMVATGAVTPLLQYQGRLTDPATGERVADGSYSMSFSLYNVETGGTALWSESESVTVQNGLFSTVLGDTVALVPSLFNGQALFIEVAVGGEYLTPRQPVLPVAYALSLVPGAIVAGSSAPVLEVDHTSGGEALRVGGNLNVSGSLIGGSHAHSGEQITSGTVADARIASTLARDSEIWPTVLASDGSGSTLDADLLDGYHASSLPGAVLKYSVFNVDCSSVAAFGTTYVKVIDVGTFSKLNPNSWLEITFNGRVSADTVTSTGAEFELRLDNVATTSGRARAHIWDNEVGYQGVPATIIGIFTGYGAGNHTVSIWVRTSYGSGTYGGVDPGCWSTDSLIVKEVR